MASSSTARNNASNPSSKSIPLLCTVCPEAPRFSDVSHLLTHIASKGHLHHEAQTRLKSHQDSAASLTLHQYEQWYREHGIEALLVERMKAKVIKEASRVKRSRGSIPSGLLPKVVTLCISPNQHLRLTLNPGSQKKTPAVFQQDYQGRAG